MSTHPIAQTLPDLCAAGHVLAEVRGSTGVLTLNRPGTLNALSLPMVRDLTTVLLHWAVVVVWKTWLGGPSLDSLD